MEPTQREIKRTPLPTLVGGVDQLAQRATEEAQTAQAWEKRTTDTSYAGATEAERSAIEQSFDAEYPSGPLARVAQKGSEKSFSENLGGALIESGHMVKDAMIVAAGMDDPTGKRTAVTLAAAAKRKRLLSTPSEMESVNELLGKTTKEYNEAEGFVETAGTVFSAALGGLKEVIDNPAGVVLLGAQSLGFAAPSMAGAMTGSAVAGPLGAVGGAFLGALGPEAGARFEEEVGKKLNEMKLLPTEENIFALMQDQKWLGEATKKAKLKAVGTALTDAAMGYGIGRGATAPLRQGQKLARKALTEAGQDVTREAVDALAPRFMKAPSFSASLGRNAKAYVQEIGSEVVSEGAGQLAAGDKLDAGELLGEALGAVGAGPIMTAVDKAAYGTKSSVKVAGTIKKALSPEAKAARVEKKVNKAIGTPETQFGYKEKVATVVETGDASEYNDPKKSTYSPGIEMAALKEKSTDESSTISEKVSTYEQGVEAYTEIEEQYTALGKEFDVIEAKGEEATVDELNRLDTVMGKMDALEVLKPKAKTMLDSMKVDKTKAPELVEQLRTMAKESNDEGVISVVKDIFGSHGGAFLSEADSVAIDDMINSPAATPETKAVLERVKAYINTKTVSDKVSDKTVSDVSTDVLAGSEDFVGVSDHLQSIAAAGTSKLAKSRLAKLKTFAATKQLRADTFQSVYDTNVGEQPKNEAAFAQMEKYNTQAKEKGFRDEDYNIGRNATNMIKNMHKEAEALQAATALASTMVHGTTPIEVAAKQASPPAQTGTQIPVTPKPVGSEQVDGDARPAPKKPGVRESQSNVELFKKLAYTDKDITNFTEDKVESILTYADHYVGKPLDELQETYDALTADDSEELEFVGELLKRLKKQKKITTPGIDYDQMAADQEDISEEDYFPPTPTEEPVDVGSTPVAEAQPSTQDGTPETTVPAANKALASKLPNIATAKKLNKNVKLLLQHFPNLLDQLHSTVLSKTKGIFTKKNPYDQDAQDLADAVNRFGRQFNARHDAVFKAKISKGELFTKDDPIQFFADKETGKLAPEVVNAMMAASFKFLATKGSKTLYNDDRAIKAILKIPNAESVSELAKKLLSEVGAHQDYLKDQLGAEIFSLLKIDVAPDAEFDFKERMVSSLGLQAIATMEQMQVYEADDTEGLNGTPLLEMTKVISGFKEGTPSSDIVHGMTGLTNEQTDANKSKYTDLASTFIIKPGVTPPRGEGTVNFYKIASQPRSKKDSVRVPHPSIQEDYLNPFNGSRNTWDLIFTGEVSKNDYSWSKFKFKEDEQFRTKKAGGLLTREQTQRLIKNMNVPYTANAPVMNAFYFLGSDQRADILGYIGDKPSHITLGETNKGIDLGILRSMSAVDDWILDAYKQEKGTDSEFFIPAEAWKQERMGQASSITTQGDKLHRSLFNMASWKHTVTMDNTDQYKAFMLGVGMYMDLEFTKEGGLDATVAKTEELMATPVMVKAIKALQKLQTKLDAAPVTPGQAQTDLMEELGSENSEDQAAIVAAVKQGEVKAQSLKALVEYAAYITAKESGAKSFETYMTIEIDGTANGPAFGRWQLMREEMDPLLHLAALQTSGFRFHEGEWDLSEHLSKALNHDAYQITGFANAMTLVDAESYLNERRSDPDAKPWQRGAAYESLVKMQAIQYLLGSPIDPKTGNVSKDMRKISKGPTMKTMYGMGKTKLTLELINTVITKTHETIAKLADAKTDIEIEKAKSDLKDINYSIQTLTGWTPEGKEFRLGEPLITDEVVDKLNISEALNIELSDTAITKIHEHIVRNEGPALYKAIESVFSPIKESSATINSALSLSTAYYNVMRKAYIDIAVNEKWGKDKAIKKENVYLTVAELDVINDRLEDIFPRVRGANDSMIPMASKDRSKVYKEGHEVRQQYGKGSTKGKAIVGQKKAYSQKYDRLEDPGVSGVVLLIQSMDAAVANRLMEHQEFLNNHDGFTIGADMGAELSDKANEIFVDINSNYSIAAEVEGLLLTSERRFLEKATEIGMDVEEALYQEFKTLSIGQEWDKVKKKFVPMSREDMFEVVNGVQADIKGELNGTKIANTAQRDELAGKLVAASQYAYADREYFTSNKPAETIFGVKPADITKARTEQLEDIIKFIQGDKQVIDAALTDNATGKIADYVLGSKKKSTLTMDKSKYTLVEEINELNVLDMYNTIKNDSTVKDSVDHDNHLKGLLGGMVQKVMQPVQLHMIKNGFAESEGKFVYNSNDKNDVFITSQTTIPGSSALSQGIRMSTGEVYSHELVHGISLHGLRAHEGLRSKVSVLYDLTMKAIAKDYPKGDGFRLFLSNPLLDITDKAYAQEVKDAQERFDYFLGTGQIRTETIINPTTGIESNKRFSNHLEEFVAFGTTNENFGNYLESVSMSRSKYTKSSWGNMKGDSIQATLINVFQKIMDFWTGTLRGGKTATNVHTELMALTARLGEVDSRYKNNLIDSVSDKLDPVTKRIHDKGNQWIKNAFVNAPVLKLATGLRGIVESRKDSDSLLGQLMRDLDAQWSSLDEGIFKSVITEAKGRTERLNGLYQLLNRAAVFVDGARTTMADTMQSVASKSFIRNQTKENPLTDSESMAVTKALLKTDATVLSKLLPKGGLLKVLQSTAELQKAVLNTLKEINDTKPADGVNLTKYALYYKAAADAAGHRMATGTGRKNEVYFRSTKTISECKGTWLAGDLSTEQMAKADDLVSKLTSLYALQYTPNDHKTTAAALMVEDEAGVNAVLSLHNIMKSEAKMKSFAGNEYLMEKGYTKELLNTRIQYTYGTLSDEKVMLAAGYTRGNYPVGRDDVDPTKKVDMYIYTSRTGRVNDMLATIAGFQGNRSKGTSSRDLANQLDLTTVEGAKNKQQIIVAKKKNLDSMTKPGFVPGDVGNIMDPIVDGLGNITDYRYTMSESTKDSVLEKINDYDVILGSMASQVTGKERSPIINAELVTTLKELYDKEYKANPGAYLEIGPKSTDPKLKELYYLFPDQMKRDIQKDWGGKAMYVAKDVMSLAFGYRQYSAMEAFTKDPKERKLFENIIVQSFNAIAIPLGSTGVTVLNNAENFASAITSYAKNTIVVKSGFVTIANMGSNLMNLKMKGIPTMTILRKSKEALIMGNKYQADKKRLDRAKLQLEIVKDQKGYTTNIENTIMRLENSIARNPVTEGIESGLMPSLMDDVDTSVGKTRHPHPLQKAIDKRVEKLHPMVAGAGKALLMTEDTQMYKVLNNAVKMTDFVGRHVLYTYNVETLKMDKAEAAAQAIEEFINFAPPTHQMIDFLNRMGVLWFTKYGIRVLKTMKTNAVDKPFDVLMTLGTASALGFDTIFGSIPGVTKGLLSNVANPVSMFLSSFGESIPIASTDMVFETVFNK